MKAHEEPYSIAGQVKRLAGSPSFRVTAAKHIALREHSEQQGAKSFETICGENDFLVVYDNRFYTVVRHFIPNDFYDGIPEPHTYNFDFKKIGDKIHLTLKIEGQDGEKIERDLVDVAGAINNIWGRQIEK
jgi:hypothetical protein